MFCELKVATRIMKQIIDQFASFDLFGRDNYEYYARVTGRVLRVQDEWICSFRYPALPGGKYIRNYNFEIVGHIFALNNFEVS